MYRCSCCGRDFHTVGEVGEHEKKMNRVAHYIRGSWDLNSYRRVDWGYETLTFKGGIIVNAKFTSFNKVVWC